MNTRWFPNLALTVLAAGMLAGCTRHASSTDTKPPYTIEGDKIVIRPDSPLLGRMETVEATAASSEAEEFRSVGQMVALANQSGALSGPSVAWVELDPGVSHSLGLYFSESSPATVGEAYGVTSVATDYAEQIHPGERIEISRYGLRKSNVAASVYSLRPPKGGGDTFQIVFRLKNGQDWYPGTNCEVLFPMIHSHAIRIPTTALLHEGIHEYLLKELRPGEFTPRGVTVVDSTAESALVMGGVNVGDRIVGRGAILLKPLLHRLLVAANARKLP